MLLLTGPQLAANAAAATLAITSHDAQGGATQPAQPWWSQWQTTDPDAACAATVAVDSYIHTVTEVAAEGTVSDVTGHASGR